MRLRTIMGALSFGALVVAPQIAQASSHREAPFVSKNPKVDGTDFYAFESYETGHTGMVTLIANYQPLQDAYGGPNYFGMDNDALYEVMIDNDGDGVEDFTFQFQFQTVLGGTSNAGFSLHIGPADGGSTNAVPFYNVGLIPGTGTAPSGALNVIETFSVNLVAGPRRTGTASPIANPGGTNVFNKPADNIGAKSFGTASSIGCEQGASGACPNPGASDYATYAKNFIYSGVTIPGCTATDKGTAQVFVGQRAEGFAVNLGPTFDLIDAPAGVVTTGGNPASYGAIPDPLINKNVTSIAIEVPRDCIWKAATQPVIGAWTTASVRQARVINPAATYVQPSVEGGAWTQVSRLGNPLVNEVVIGLPDKDAFNSSAPADDGTTSPFGKYVEFPTLPAVIDIVFGTDLQPTGAAFPRTDLVAAFLTGLNVVAGVPLNAFPTVTADGGIISPAPVLAEYVHLNTNTEGLLTAAGLVTTTPTASGSQNRLGAALCAPHGSVVTTTLETANYAPATSCDPFGFPNGRRPVDDVVDIALDTVEGYLLPVGQAPAFPATAANWVLFTDGVDQASTSSTGAASKFTATFPYLGTPTQGANGNGT